MGVLVFRKSILYGLVLVIGLLVNGRADNEMSTDYMSVLCITDSAGTVIRIWGIDTAVVLEKVVKVVYGASGYVVTLKSGKTATFPRPPFRRASIHTPVKEKKVAPAPKVKSKKSKRHHKEPTKGADKWPGTD